MASEYGKDWRIKLQTGTGPAVYVSIGGETGFEWQRSSQEVDLSDKDSGAYGSKSYAQQTITFNISGNVKLPDVGLQKAFDTAKASPPEIVLQVVKGAIVKFEGLVGIGNFSTSHNKDGSVTYTFNASNIGAPTTDNLGATV